MKQFLIVATAFFTLNALGQINNLKVPLVKSTNTQLVSQNDTVLKVFWVCSNDSERNPAYYLNGQFVNESILKTLNPKVIDKIRVEKQEIIVENQKYYGQIFINTKEDYSPKLVSLNDLKSKNTNLKDATTIFMIDNEIVNGNYDKCIVDENYLLRISIEKIENEKEKLHFYLIQILTMSEENIRKSKEIRIRGLQLSQPE
jgi:carboxylesterase type B